MIFRGREIGLADFLAEEPQVLIDFVNEHAEEGGGGLAGVTRTTNKPDAEFGEDGNWALGENGALYIKREGEWVSVFEMENKNTLLLSLGQLFLKASGKNGDSVNFYLTDKDEKYQLSIDPEGSGAVLMCWDSQGNLRSNATWWITNDGYEVSAHRDAPADNKIEPGEAWSFFDATDGDAAYVRRGRTEDGTIVQVRSKMVPDGAPAGREWKPLELSDGVITQFDEFHHVPQYSVVDGIITFRGHFYISKEEGFSSNDVILKVPDGTPLPEKNPKLYMHKDVGGGEPKTMQAQVNHTTGEIECDQAFPEDTNALISLDQCFYAAD